MLVQRISYIAPIASVSPDSGEVTVIEYGCPCTLHMVNNKHYTTKNRFIQPPPHDAGVSGTRAVQDPLARHGPLMYIPSILNPATNTVGYLYFTTDTAFRYSRLPSFTCTEYIPAPSAPRRSPVVCHSNVW